MKYKEESKTEHDYGDFFEVKEFRNLVKNGCFIPSDITHVWWFNK